MRVRLRLQMRFVTKMDKSKNRRKAVEQTSKTVGSADDE